MTGLRNTQNTYKTLILDVSMKGIQSPLIWSCRLNNQYTHHGNGNLTIQEGPGKTKVEEGQCALLKLANISLCLSLNISSPGSHVFRSGLDLCHQPKRPWVLGLNGTVASLPTAVPTQCLFSCQLIITGSFFTIWGSCSGQLDWWLPRWPWRCPCRRALSNAQLSWPVLPHPRPPPSLL